MDLSSDIASRRPKTKPLLFITGFLGAGKTTLLRNLVRSLGKRGDRADVILNDFANADLDAATLDDSAAASIAPIAASCACCDSLDELVGLCGAAARGEGDLLLIELNGTADPLALLETFTLLEDRLPFFPRLQTCLVDTRHWGRRGDFAPLERRQLETAGSFVLSHCDAVEEARLAEVAGEIRSVAPHARRSTAEELAVTLVEEFTAQPVPDPAREPPRFHLVPEPAAATFSPLGLNPRSADPAHLLSHRFTGCQFPLPPRLRRHAIERLLLALPEWVMRAKALVKLADDPGCRWLFERSGSDPLREPIPVPDITRVPSSLVCVGPRLDPDLLHSLVREQLGWEPASQVRSPASPESAD